ncbi:MAG TPA: methyltransferase domain-containing protein [Polyangiaceae bacterium]
MDASGSHHSNQRYYDAFAAGYERLRGHNDPGGYHEMLDELESEYVARFGSGKDVLEVGCGTGLVLQRIKAFARSARGVDLSPGMLEKARARELDVSLASATALPFEDETFDVTCSFKVLAHVPEIELALSEMARVTRPGGYVLAELYNPHSLRALIKRFGPAGSIAHGAHEKDVYLRFDSPARAKQLTPASCEHIGARGIRILTPTAHLMRIPVVRGGLCRLEHWLCDSPLRVFGGFYVAAYRKRG